MTMTDLPSLLERVERATEGSYELDRAINDAFGIDNKFHEHERWSQSLDAAIALVERCSWRVHAYRDNSWSLRKELELGGLTCQVDGEECATMAISMLSTLLRAKIAEMVC